MPGAPPSRLMVEGSTGGAGLRGLEGEEPHPLAMSVLYFDNLHALQAYDDIQVGGAGQAQVTLNRTVVEQPPVPPGPAEGQRQPPAPRGDPDRPQPSRHAGRRFGRRPGSPTRGCRPQCARPQLPAVGAPASRISSRTVLASAWPLVAFITAPTRAPAAATLPSRTFCATSGLAAIASSTAAVKRAGVGDHREPAGGHHLGR